MSRLAMRLRSVLAATMLVGCAAHASAQPFLYLAPNAANVIVLNAPTLNEMARIQLPSNQVPFDLALGFEARRLYVTTVPRAGASTAAGSLVVIDTLTNSIIHTIPFPQAARAVTVSRDGQRIYVGRDVGILTIIRASDFAVIGEVPVGIEPSDAALTPDESWLYVVNYQSGNVSAIDLVTFAATTIPVGSLPLHLAISPDGREVFVSNQSGSLSVIDAASRAVSETIVIPADSPSAGPPQPSALGFSPSGSKLYIGDARFGVNGAAGPIRIMNVATRAITTDGFVGRAYDVAIDPSAMRAYFYASTSSKFDLSWVRVLDLATDTVETATNSTGIGAFGRGAIALGNPAGCAFEIDAAKLAQFGPPGGSASVGVPAPPGCSWTTASPVPWISFTPASGSGPGRVTYTVAANSGEPRSAIITVAGQAIQVRQTIPQTWIDEPVSGTTHNQPVRLRGWALDRDDTATGGTGIDAIHVYAYPGGGGAPIFLGQANSESRQDIANVYGQKYVAAGFTFDVRGLAAGTYTLVVYAHSARTGVFDARSVTVTLTSASSPAGFVDAPRDGDEVTQPFLVAGWAADLARGSGTGVDAVHVYAYPEAGGSPIFLGTANYGTWQRPDVAGYYKDSSLASSGFLLLADGLPIGRHRIVAFAHSTVTGEFFARAVTVNMIGSSQAIMQIDVALVQSNRAVQLIGWAADRRATTGNGISVLHVYAYPDSGAAPVFLGSLGSPGTDRIESELMLGAQFRRSGWGFTSSPLTTGGYRIVVYAQSSVTGTFDAVRVVRVIIP